MSATLVLLGALALLLSFLCGAVASTWAWTLLVLTQARQAASRPGANQ